MGRVGLILSLLALPQGTPSGGKTAPRAGSLDSEFWAISSSANALPARDFRDFADGLYGAWKTKAGAGALEPGKKLNLKLHFDRDEYNSLPNRSGGWTLDDEHLHLLCDPTYGKSLAAGGPRIYLREAYPKLAARKDVPPWIFNGLAQYLACAEWSEGQALQDSLKQQLVSQSVLAYQSAVKSSDWAPLEKSFKAEGRDYEIRKRIIDAQAWAVFYWLFNSPAAEGGQGKHAALVVPFLAALEEGKKLDDALAPLLKAATGGNLDKLDKAVKDYFIKFNLETKDREEGDWWVGETAHYTIRVQKGAMNKKTKAKDRQILEELKWKMELLFEKYALAFRYQGLLSQKAQLRLYKNRVNYIGSGAPPGSAAYYSTGTKELVGYEDSEETGMYWNTLCHEGCHQFFDLAFPGFYESDSLPMWFSEGLADCFGASEIRGRDMYVFTLGGTASWRVDTIKEAVQQGRAIPLKDLLDMGRQPFMARADMLYPQSWSFTHFLWNYPTLDGGKGQYAEVLVRLIDGFKVGKPKDEVYKEAFQIKGKPLNIEELEKQWKAYVKTLRVRK